MDFRGGKGQSYPPRRYRLRRHYRAVGKNVDEFAFDVFQPAYGIGGCAVV